MTQGAFLSGYLYSLQSHFQSQEHLSGGRPSFPRAALPSCTSRVWCVPKHTQGRQTGSAGSVGGLCRLQGDGRFKHPPVRSLGGAGLALCPRSASGTFPISAGSGLLSPSAAPASSWAWRMPTRCPELRAATDPSHTHPGERSKHGAGFMAPAVQNFVQNEEDIHITGKLLIVPQALSKAGRLDSSACSQQSPAPRGDPFPGVW